MAIAFDAQSTLAVGTGDRNFSHNPVGTPRGVLVIVVHEVGTDTVAGVTYGGTALVEVPLSPLLHTTPETGSVHAFFLGTSVPSADPATVAIDVTDALDYIAACFSVTAAADTVIHDTSTFDSGATTAPSATLTISQSVFVAGGLYSGLAAPGSTEVAGTVEVVTGDLGADSGEISRGDSLKTTDFAYGWTQASDDGAVLAVAIAEAAPQLVTPGVASLTTATFAPTVTAPNNQLVTPGVAALTLASFAPTVTATANQIVTPGVAALTTSTFAPVLNLGIVPSTASLALTAFAPGITVTDNQTVTPGVASLALATFAPTVSTPVTVAPDVAAVVLTTFAPAVTASDHKTVTPSPLALALTSFAPTVTSGGGLTVTPDVAALLLTTFAPTVSATASQAPSGSGVAQRRRRFGTEPMRFSPVFAPPAVINTTVTPVAAALTLTTFAPSVIVNDDDLVLLLTM
jgi:hypothetical protein